MIIFLLITHQFSLYITNKWSEIRFKIVFPTFQRDIQVKLNYHKKNYSLERDQSNYIFVCTSFFSLSLRSTEDKFCATNMERISCTRVKDQIQEFNMKDIGKNVCMCFELSTYLLFISVIVVGILCYTFDHFDRFIINIFVCDFSYVYIVLV